MMKKAASIFFLCLFFLFGLQCVACNKKEVSLAKIEIKNCQATDTFQRVSKQKKSATFSSIEKLHKKKRFSRTHQNATPRLSKCNGSSLGPSNFPSDRFSFLENLEIRKDLLYHNFQNPFCHRKRLSIFYSFQAFW